MEIMDKDSKKSDIEDKFFEEFNIKKKEKRENAETDKEELKKIILNDPEFSYMKNQYLRNEYLNKLLLTNGMSKYKYLFDGGYDRKCKNRNNLQGVSITALHGGYFRLFGLVIRG